MEAFRKYLEQKCRLNPQGWDHLSGFFSAVTLPRNTHFITQGEANRQCGFILEGVLRYFSSTEKGDDPTCYFSFENHIVFDPYTYRTNVPASLNAVAVTDCRLAVISMEEEQKLLAVFPQWMDICNQLLLEVSLEFANQKTMMAMKAAERYAFFCDTYPHLAKRVPLQFIASYLGIAQPSLSRIRKNTR
jgi:CRP-like cAMP-binding protein